MLKLNYEYYKENKSINDINILLEEKGHNINIADQLWLKTRIEQMRADNKIFVDKLLQNTYFRTAVTLQLQGMKISKKGKIQRIPRQRAINYVKAFKDMKVLRDRVNHAEGNSMR
jgi:hypothetical protein